MPRTGRRLSGFIGAMSALVAIASPALAVDTFIPAGQNFSVSTPQPDVDNMTVGSTGQGPGLGQLTLTANGQQKVNASLTIGSGNGFNGTVNLDGGVLTVQTTVTNGGISTFNFNGGTLRAIADAPNFMQGLTLAQIRNGGAVIDTNGVAITIGQALVHSTIGGDAPVDGGLTVTGTGTLTLTGALSYAGRTTVNGGSLVLGDATNSVTLPGDATLATGTTLDIEHGSLGTGSIDNSNGGTIAFAFFGDNPATAGSARITNAGTLTFGNRSDAGNATITSTGFIDFSGNSSAGAARISLDAAGGGVSNAQFRNSATAANAVIAVNDGILTFAETSTAGAATITTGAGADLGGKGTIFQDTASGGTSRQIVEAGGLLDITQLVSRGTTIGSLEGAGVVALGRKTLTIGGDNLSTTFSGTIQDAGLGNGAGGGIVKTGTGTLILSGTNTYTGRTRVQGGTLQIDGSLASANLTIASGGTLSGTGKIGDPTIQKGGTLAPGNAANPYGTLTMGGPLTIRGGSTYRVNIAADGRNSKTNVVAGAGTNGTAQIRGGAVKVQAAFGNYVATRYTILTATGGVTGTFKSVSTNLAFLLPTLAYDPNNVYLDVTRLSFTTGARTRNQAAIGLALDAGNTRNNGGANAILAAFNQLTSAEAPGAFDAVSGEGILATQNLAYRASALFTSAIGDATLGAGAGNSLTLTEAQPGFTALATPQPHVRELADPPSGAPPPAPPAFARRTWRAWASGYGGVETLRGDATGAGSAQQNDTLYGGQLGVDYQLLSNDLVGVALGGSNGDFTVPTRQTSGTTTGGHVALYNLATFGAFYGFSTTTFSYFTNKTTRVAGGFGGLASETERGTFDSHEFRSHLEFGRRVETALGTITPFVALELAQLRANGFSETSLTGPGLLRLNLSAQSQASVPAFVGARYSSVIPLGTLTLRPVVEAAWVHEFAPQRTQIGQMIDLPGSTFLIEGARPAWNSVKVKGGGELALGPNTALFASFDGEFSNAAQFYAGSGGWKWVW